jgi:hypothetical protein
MIPRILAYPALLALAAVVSNPLVPTLRAAEGDQAEPLQAKLSYTPLKNWKIVLPAERWTNAEEGINVPHFGVEGFKAEKVGQLKLGVDTNGDGSLDKDVKGSSGFLKLQNRESGETFQYAIRVRFEGDNFQYSTGCAMSGKVGGVLIKLIDQNHNGRYDDFGKDAMIVGSGKGASLLSRVVNLDGVLYGLSVTPDGRQVECTPYTGETGQLDVSSRFESNGKLIAAVFGKDTGDVYFNPARSKKPLLVPVGEYEFVAGYVAQGAETVKMRGGKMTPLSVKPGGTRTVEWGGPLVAEFDFRKEDEEVIVQPNVAFYGRMGEEYHTFTPNAKSPKIIVTDKRTRKEVASGRFGGC